MATQDNFWWGIGLGVVAGWFLFTATGRSVVRAGGRATAKGIKHVGAKARKRLEKIGK